MLDWQAMFTVALISRKCGAWKTTLACGLAVAGERKVLATALVDLDPQGSASAWANLRVADLLAVGSSIDITRQAGTAAAVIRNAAPVQGPFVAQARNAIAGYDVEMVPVVLHQRIAHVHAFTDGLTATELTRAGKAGTELAAVFRWTHNKGLSLNG